MTLHVLLVEDSPAIAAVMVARLADLGYSVCTAQNGALGVEHFERERPDLVLMDLEMPVMDGFEATHRMRALEAQEEWAWTPILFLTASNTDKNLVAAIDAGADDFLAKSVPDDILRAKMRAMERIALLRNGLRSAHQKLEELAQLDGLTRVANRRALDQRSDQLWSEAVSRGSAFSLLMLDLDHFKEFNDIYGHLAGDDCLRRVAQVIAGAASDADLQAIAPGSFGARYGGEEFAVVVPNAAAHTVSAVADRIRGAVQALAIAHRGNSAWQYVTVSIGGCRTARATGHIKHVFRSADAELYHAKRCGRNRVAFDSRSAETPAEV